jgi:5,10-methylenetetrahydrofolate reductase
MSLRQKIEARQFALLGEFQPPKGADFSPLLDAANPVKGRLDAIVVPEMAQAVLKASSLGGCAFLQRHGLETVLQACPRDRNRLALQADILSAAALGIPNLMLIEGDDITLGDHIQARAVNDLDLSTLLAAVQNLQAGQDMAGISLTEPTRFCIGSAMDLGLADRLRGRDLDQLKEVADKGVSFVITGPVFDVRQYKDLMEKVEMTPLAILPTVLVLKSVGMAKYAERNIKNVSIPPEVIRAMEKSPDRPRAGLRIAAELVRQLREAGAAGVMISTRGWEDRLPFILDMAR